VTTNDDEALGTASTATEETKDTPLGGGKRKPKDDLLRRVVEARAARRGVTIYLRPDLQADIDRVSAELATARGEEADRLTAQATELTAHLKESALHIIVEGRRSTWVDEFHQKLEEAGVTDTTEQILHQVAAQIVEPEGLDYEVLQKLLEVVEPQITQVVAATLSANNERVILDPRFSRAS
jgi:hypothetical protein